MAKMPTNHIVWKYSLAQADGREYLELDYMIPKGAEFLSILVTVHGPAIYFLVDPEEPNVVSRFAVVGTGIRGLGKSDTIYAHLGSYVSGTYIGHVFEIQEI